MIPTDNREWLRLAVNKCPHGVYMISLDYGSGGTRIAGVKCCGRWTVEREFAIRAATLQDAADEAKDYEETAARSGNGSAEEAK